MLWLLPSQTACEVPFTLPWLLAPSGLSQVESLQTLALSTPAKGPVLPGGSQGTTFLLTWPSLSSWNMRPPCMSFLTTTACAGTRARLHRLHSVTSARLPSLQSSWKSWDVVCGVESRDRFQGH